MIRKGVLVEYVDEILDLVNNWNDIHCETEKNTNNKPKIKRVKNNDDKPWTADELNQALRHISNAVIKYGMLNVPNKDLTFDLKKWCLSSGNTGPYLMMNYARIASIFDKVKYPNIDSKEIDYSVLSEDIQAQQLLFQMCQFQTKIYQICEERNASSLCDYLYSMCKLFSQWYGNADHSIKFCQDNNLKMVRLNFCQAVAKCIGTGMKLLGITPLERM